MADPRELLHTGQISERDEDAGACRVALDDFQGIVSGKMQLLFPAVDHWNFIAMPKPGDHVAMLRMPNGSQEGYIIGKPYTAENMPQGITPGKFGWVSSDGKNFILFDALKGTLDLVVDQTGTLKYKFLDTIVDVDETREVGNDQSLLVKHDQTNEILNDKTETVHGNEEETIHGTTTITEKDDRTYTNEKNVTKTIKQNLTTKIGQNETRNIGGNQDTKATGTINFTGATINLN